MTSSSYKIKNEMVGEKWLDVTKMNAHRDREGIIKSWIESSLKTGGIERYDDLHVDQIDPSWKKRARWRTTDGDILEWDYRHGRVEKYNKQGRHKGEYDPNTGQQTKPADPGRRIEP